MPGDSVVLPVNAPGLSSGRVPCTVRLHDGSGPPVSWSGVVQVPDRQRHVTIHTGDGAYATIPANGVPAWAYALMGISGLAIVSAAGVFLLYLRR